MHYMILNGKDLLLIVAENMGEAKEKAVALCDHSKEIIVREIETFEDYNSGISTRL